MTSTDDKDWSKIVAPARDAYWAARRDGADESTALIAALKVAVEVAMTRKPL
jgi:hypothetical protein